MACITSAWSSGGHALKQGLEVEHSSMSE